jgi:hypothetical protein
MRALKKARKLIESRHETQEAIKPSALVVALESEQLFKLSDLYQLNYDDFGLAVEVMAEWRLDRYYASKVRLLGASVQAGDIPTQLNKVA